MAWLLNRMVVRLWLLAGLMTAVTSLVGMLVYRVSVYFQMHDWAAHMPPKARAELEYLVSTGQQGSDRFYELYDRFGWNALGWNDLPFLGAIILISTIISGAVAMVLAQQMSRPITAVARAAARVSAGDRSMRVEKGGTTGEIGDLIDNFNKMAEAIDRYETERSILTAGITHELRTPLTILKGRLHGIADGVIAPGTGETERLLRQVDHILRMVEDLGTLVHAEVGELPLDMRVVDVSDILRLVVADLRPVVAVHRIGFIERYAPAPVLGDSVRLTQVFTNLLTNAVKHSPAGGKVGVMIDVSGDAAVVSIVDEGPGFAPADRERLFVPFWRAAANKHAGRPGTGMGLALAARLVKTHHGHIIAENRRDRAGARFSVKLPLAWQAPG